MALTAWLVILPLSIATLVAGLVQTLGTAWGVLSHYWVLFKLVLTSVATGVLLLKMLPVSISPMLQVGPDFDGVRNTSPC